MNFIKRFRPKSTSDNVNEKPNNETATHVSDEKNKADDEEVRSENAVTPSESPTQLKPPTNVIVDAVTNLVENLTLAQETPLSSDALPLDSVVATQEQSTQEPLISATVEDTKHTTESRITDNDLPSKEAKSSVVELEQETHVETKNDDKLTLENNKPNIADETETIPINGEGDAQEKFVDAPKSPEAITDTEKFSEIVETTKKEDEQESSEENFVKAVDKQSTSDSETEQKRHNRPNLSDSGSDENESETSEQDSAKEKEENGEEELDDDEIKENPAYIPKMGQFYMHDHRSSNQQCEEQPAGEKDDEKRERHTRADVQRWSHDLYNERQQTPRSGRELENRYGYDIRSDMVTEEGESSEQQVPRDEPVRNRGRNRRPVPAPAPASSRSNANDQHTSGNKRGPQKSQFRRPRQNKNFDDGNVHRESRPPPNRNRNFRKNNDQNRDSDNQQQGYPRLRTFKRSTVVGASLVRERGPRQDRPRAQPNSHQNRRPTHETIKNEEEVALGFRNLNSAQVLPRRESRANREQTARRTAIDHQVEKVTTTTTSMPPVADVPPLNNPLPHHNHNAYYRQPPHPVHNVNGVTFTNPNPAQFVQSRSYATGANCAPPPMYGAVPPPHLLNGMPQLMPPQGPPPPMVPSQPMVSIGPPPPMMSAMGPPPRAPISYRQPTNVVYFDPPHVNAQPPRELPRRERRRLEFTAPAQ